MVTFAPQEQQMQAPQYWFMSRPITGVETDTSKEKLLKGAGEALTGGVNIAENFVESTIKHEATAGLDTINQQAIERLNAAKANPALIDQDARELPSAVKGLPKDLDQLDQARAHGKLSQTYIDMQKYQLAQSLRARYAGHRDFIDEAFAKSNREDPANKVVGSLIGDINSLAAGAESKRTEIKSLAIDALKRFPSSAGADVMAAGALSGRVKEDAFLSWYWKYSAQDSDEKREDLRIKRDEANIKFAGIEGKEVMTGRLNNMAADYFYNHQLATPGLLTPAEILEYSRKLSAGEIAPNDEATKKKAMQIEQAKVQFLIDADRMLDDHKPGERSYRSIIGEEEAKRVKEGAAERFTQLGKMFTDDKSGLSHLALDITKAQSDDTRYHLFNPPPGSPDADTAARYLRIMSAIMKDASPETQTMLFKGVLTEGSGLDETLKKMMVGQNAAGVTQPDGKDNPVTAKATVNELANNPAVKRLPKEQKAALFDTAFSNIDILTSPKANITDKRNVATQFFDPKNRGVLGNFDQPSQMKLWDKLTNDKVAAEMHKLGGQYFENYSGWVKDTFGTQLFPESIQILNKFGDLSNIKVTWDNKEHQFDIKSTAVTAGPKGARGELPDPELRQVQQAKDDLNKGLWSISGLAKYDHRDDPNAYILKMLIDSGIKEGLVHELTKAVVNSGKMLPNEGKQE